MTIFWVDPTTGSILLATSEDGKAPTADAVAITVPAESGKQVWSFVTKSWSSPPPKPELPLTAEELAIQMIKDGTMTQAKIDTIKADR